MPAELAAERPATEGLFADVRARRVLRFAIGVTLSTALAYLIGFELPFLVPILVAMLLGSPAPRPAFRSGVAFVAPIAVAAFLGVLLTRYLLPFRLIFLLIEFLVLWWIFYGLAGGAAPLRMVWLLIAALLIPLLGTASIGLSVGIALGLVEGAIIALISTWLSFGLLPDQPVEPAPVTGGLDSKPAKEVPPPEARAAFARRSLIVIYPVLFLFFVNGWADQAVVLLFAALLSLLPSFAAGWKVGKDMIIGNLIGGVAAILFYQLLLIRPSFSTFALLTFISALLFAEVIFSDRPIARLFKTAFNALLLLVGMSVAITGVDASSRFYTRIAQIMLAVTYVAAAFGWLEYLQRKRTTE
ncbi:MAG: DUF2955 domain-containing protein [Gemmatimonadota bacterium]